jgi:hypothetical protein
MQRHDPAGDARRVGAPRDQSMPADQPVVERMNDKDKLSAAAARGERRDDRARRIARITVRRMGAEREIGLQLQRHEEVGTRLLRQSPLGGRRRARRQQLWRPRAQPAGVFEQGVAGAVVAVMRIQQAPADEPQIVGNDARCDEPERRVKARCEVGLGKLGGQFANALRIAGKPRIGHQAVVFERQPVRPQVAEIGRDDRNAAGPRLFGGDQVIGTTVAVQHQVGHGEAVQKLANELPPINETPAEILRRQVPEQPIAEVQVDPVDAMPARNQGAAEAVEERRNRSLQKQKGSRRATRACRIGRVAHSLAEPPAAASPGTFR